MESYTNKERLQFRRDALQARREALNRATDQASLEMTKKMIQEYEAAMRDILMDEQKCLKPLDLWLPFCDRTLPGFEQRIQEDGYVCMFTKQMSGSEYFDTRQIRKGYLVAETADDLKKNWKDPFKHE